MKVKMTPHLDDIGDSVGGIHTVIRKYWEHLPAHGIELVSKDASDYDLHAIHAGMRSISPSDGVVYAHIHGLYWSGMYDVTGVEHKANRNLVNNIRGASGISVPSTWVAETFWRDMRYRPDIISHGVDAHEWNGDYSNLGYVLWAKNRPTDVCTPEPAMRLANMATDVEFMATFGRKSKNFNVVGIISSEQMYLAMGQAGVYLSTTKETFGITLLEAMAAGVPVLGWDYGGNRQIVEHGVTGYLARPDDYDDLYKGLRYCLKNRKVLSANAKKMVGDYTWNSVAESVALAYRSAHERYHEPPTVGVVIPVYNKKREYVQEAVESAVNQTRPPDKIIVVDDGSDDPAIARTVAEKFPALCELIRKDNGGVATARNAGIEALDTKYVVCLDADDALKPDFVESCLGVVEKDASVHLVYGQIEAVMEDGSTQVTQWPGAWDFDAQIRRRNQIPTANMMRRDTVLRLGGYKQRYAPTGAGSEDAELWTRFGAYGYKAEFIPKPLFVYRLGQGHTSQDGYRETDWLSYHPWTVDKRHPFASYATPVNGAAHLVRYYDEPTVSVIIPVGPTHGDLLFNALDSLEAQSFRNWEVIVIDDTGGENLKGRYQEAYPYVNWQLTSGRSGAGIARNVGAREARGGFLLFLDADDTLYSNCIEEMIATWKMNRKIPYSDYVGVVHTNTPEELIEQVKSDPFRRVEAQRGNTLIIHHDAARRYDCERAVQQPQRGSQPYLWCLVSVMVPRAWHNAIGGFDENMRTWEDVDYMWRLAKAGYCFVRIPQALVAYRFSTGTRRAMALPSSGEGLQMAREMLQYLEKKHKDIHVMGCNCGGNKQKAANAAVARFSASQTQSLQMNGELVLVEYQNNKGAAHPVYGSVTRTKYGYRSPGDQFFVHPDDVWSRDGFGNTVLLGDFIPIDKQQIAPLEERETPDPAPLDDAVRIDQMESLQEVEAPVSSAEAKAKVVSNTINDPLSDDELVTALTGVGPKTASVLETVGVTTVGDLVGHSMDTLVKAGISPKIAAKILSQI